MTKTAKTLLISTLAVILAALTFYAARYGSALEAPGAENALEVAFELSASAEAALNSGAAKRIELSDADARTVAIAAPGVYRVSGSLSEGQLIVDCKGSVALILDGVKISNSADAALYISNADHTLIYLPEGSESSIVSGVAREITEAAESETGAALYSRDSLFFAGDGKLTVSGYINNAVATTDHLIVIGGEMEITAANNGFKGKDSVTILGGDIRVQSGNDGIKSDSGSVEIRGGVFDIRSLGDGIDAEGNLTVTDSEITVFAGNPEALSASSDTAAFSAEGFPGEALPPDMPGFSAGMLPGSSGETTQPSVPGNPGEAALPGIPGFNAGMFPGNTSETTQPSVPGNPGEAALPGMPGFNAGMFPGNSSETTQPSVPGNPGEAALPGIPGFNAGMLPGSSDETTQPSVPGNPGEAAPPAFGAETPQARSRDSGRWADGRTDFENRRGQGDFPNMSDWKQNGGTESDSGAKGLKSGGDLTVLGGSVTVNSTDDCIHANGNIVIQGGTFLLSSGDDGLHADDAFTLSDGSVTVSQSYEGIEGHRILISGGTVSVTASDDGINANGNTATEKSILTISGGTVYVNANGDGLDSNGDLIVEGGSVVVDGPANGGNGALDSGAENGGSLLVNGGTVLAIGASRMAETFGGESAQCSFIKTLSETAPPGTKIVIRGEDGSAIFEHTSAKSFDSVVFSSPALAIGSVCTLVVGDQTETVSIESVSNGQSFGMWGGFRR